MACGRGDLFVMASLSKKRLDGWEKRLLTLLFPAGGVEEGHRRHVSELWGSVHGTV